MTISNNYYQNQENIYWEKLESVIVPSVLRLDYIDAEGRNSQRTISIQEYNGGAYLRGFCELRYDFRTFRIDRINQCIDTETGDIVYNIPDYLLQKYRSSLRAILDKIFPQITDILKVLLYISKADGRFTEDENELVRGTVKRAIKDTRLTEKDITSMISKLDIPTLHGFKIAVGKIGRKSIKNLEITYIISRKIAESDKEIHPAEQESLDYIQKKLEVLKKIKKESLTAA